MAINGTSCVCLKTNRKLAKRCGVEILMSRNDGGRTGALGDSPPKKKNKKRGTEKGHERGGKFNSYREGMKIWGLEKFVTQGHRWM